VRRLDGALDLTFEKLKSNPKRCRPALATALQRVERLGPRMETKRRVARDGHPTVNRAQFKNLRTAEDAAENAADAAGVVGAVASIAIAIVLPVSLLVTSHKALTISLR
jgi:hypothetical protein